MPLAWTAAHRCSFALLLLSCLIGLLACGGGADRSGSPRVGETGLVRIDGSSTVFPITRRVKQEFEARHPGWRVVLPGVRSGTAPAGSGGGLRRLVRGELHMAAASRPMSRGELELAQLNGVEPIELPLGFDGISVVVHPDNDWIEEISTHELRRLWRPDSQVRTWADLRKGLPDRPIRLLAPGTDSGTYDHFTKVIVGIPRRSRSDFTASEDDEKLVAGVLGDRDALAFFGYGYVAAHPELEALAVDAGGGPVAPTPGTIGSGRYAPLSRPLFLYVDAVAAERRSVDAFVELLLGNLERFVGSAGYAPLTPSMRAAVRERYRERRTGLGWIDEPHGNSLARGK